MRKIVMSKQLYFKKTFQKRMVCVERVFFIHNLLPEDLAGLALWPPTDLTELLVSPSTGLLLHKAAI
jgi:hypothetical protein